MNATAFSSMMCTAQTSGTGEQDMNQTGKRQRLRYRTVQNPVVRSLAREKTNSRNMHPYVIAQTDKINEGNKRNLAEQKADLVGMLRKRQHDVHASFIGRVN